MILDWEKCESKPCSFLNLDLSEVEDSGVYVIWSDPANDDESPYAVYVGQGNVADRIKVHQKDPDILKHGTDGILYVTWANLWVQYRDGVEAFLAQQLSPVEGERHPDVSPVLVNLPQLG